MSCNIRITSVTSIDVSIILKYLKSFVSPQWLPGVWPFAATASVLQGPFSSKAPPLRVSRSPAPPTYARRGWKGLATNGEAGKPGCAMCHIWKPTRLYNSHVNLWNRKDHKNCTSGAVHLKELMDPLSPTLGQPEIPLTKLEWPQPQMLGKSCNGPIRHPSFDSPNIQYLWGLVIYIYIYIYIYNHIIYI